MNKKNGKMNNKNNNKPTIAELEILQILWKNDAATVKTVNDILNQKKEVGYTTTLKIMQIMFEKGLLVRRKAGRKYLYSPAISKKKAETSAVQHMLSTYFDDSVESAVSALLRLRRKDLSEEYLERLKDIIDRHKKEGG